MLHSLNNTPVRATCVRISPGECLSMAGIHCPGCSVQLPHFEYQEMTAFQTEKAGDRDLKDWNCVLINA